MIVDSHMHPFPNVGGPSGYPSAKEHLDGVQRQSYFNVNPTRKKADNSVVGGQTLWNGKDLGPAGLRDVNFRSTEYGRMEWEADGVPVYVQLFAPSLKDNTSEAEYVIAEMDYAE